MTYKLISTFLINKNTKMAMRKTIKSHEKLDIIIFNKKLTVSVQ